MITAEVHGRLLSYYLDDDPDDIYYTNILY